VGRSDGEYLKTPTEYLIGYRMVHSLKNGDSIGLRGPIPTFTLKPSDYSKIIMVSYIPFDTSALLLISLRYQQERQSHHSYSFFLNFQWGTLPNCI
jgi:hypothetical protein